MQALNYFRGFESLQERLKTSLREKLQSRTLGEVLSWENEWKEQRRVNLDLVALSKGEKEIYLDRDVYDALASCVRAPRFENFFGKINIPEQDRGYWVEEAKQWHGFPAVSEDEKIETIIYLTAVQEFDEFNLNAFKQGKTVFCDAQSYRLRDSCKPAA